ncbi:MAG: Alpha-hydroxy-acid oxidizing enzyme [Planctomycetaceae bacterium]|nr:Alpha-hydroxy-acid oxidizing enzyme [Planctomycetaceae bacterium]
MNRRTFAQQVTLGAASLGILHAEETPREAATSEVPHPGEFDKSLPREPVKVNDFQALAAAKLPKATFEYITTGSADEITLRENIAAFQRIRILPPLLTGVASADPSTTVLKQAIKFPVMLAPVAGQQMYHPHGALAAARAAAAAGTVYGISSSVGHSVEEVGAASTGPKWFQLYVPKDRAVAKRLVERAEMAGCKAIILTVDMGEWKDADRRNRFALPKETLVKHLRDVGFTQIVDTMTYEEILAFNAQAWDLAISWEFFDWLRGVTKLPLIIKGVLRKDDAAKAVSLGIDGIVVSNHGGRRLDGMPATIEMLPELVQTVGGRAEVYLDGGIRRGTDVLIALALGARAVLIGRPYAWALGANGEAGVRKVLDLLREEFLNAMVATGCSKISDIQPTLLRRP